MHGEPVELRDLEFIPQESVEADYRIGGLQTLKFDSSKPSTQIAA